MNYNIYAGLKGKITYQETEEFEDSNQATQRAMDIAHADAEAYGWNIENLGWQAVPTEEDSIPEEDLVGSKYL